MPSLSFEYLWFRPRSWLAFYPSSLPFPPSLSETGGVVLPSRVLGGEVRGYADVEIALLPMAAREPVGRGRQEPNRNPFLDGDDREIRMHASRVGID